MISMETNEAGEPVKVTRIGNSVIRELFLPVAQAPSVWRSYGYAEFIDALTPDEAVAFVQAKAAQPRLEVWVELARVRGINFDDPATRAAAPLLVSLGVLTSARLDELMGG
jgi:hypothetical protein